MRRATAGEARVTVLPEFQRRNWTCAAGLPIPRRTHGRTLYGSLRSLARAPTTRAQRLDSDGGLELCERACQPRRGPAKLLARRGATAPDRGALRERRAGAQNAGLGAFPGATPRPRRRLRPRDPATARITAAGSGSNGASGRDGPRRVLWSRTPRPRAERGIGSDLCAARVICCTRARGTTGGRPGELPASHMDCAGKKTERCVSSPVDVSRTTRE